MADALPSTWLAICVFALTLGIRHGLDADHLATIDGLARRNASRHPRLAHFSGTLFSLGHGIVVLGVAAGASLLAASWRTPLWLEVSGTGISIAFLLGLAFLNLHAVWTTPPHQVVVPAGIRSRLFNRIIAVDRPLYIAAVGMLFALSFDTVSQAALFAVAAGRFGGLVPALMLAGCFVFGMLLADGANGFWIARLIRRADAKAAVASRVMATAVGCVSLAIGGLTLARLLLPALETAMEETGIWAGVVVIAAIALAFLVALFAASLAGSRSESYKTPAE